MNGARLAERRKKQRFWDEHLCRWKESGLSQSAYCREHGRNLHRYIYWKQPLLPEKWAPSASPVKRNPSPGSTGAREDSFLT